MDIRFKKLIAGASALALVATQALSGVVYGIDYQTELQQAYQWAKSVEMTNAETFDAFEPQAQLSRGTAAKLFAIFGERVLGMNPDTAKECNFSDIDGKWYAEYAVKACQLGLMKGNEGRFEGDRELYKSEAVVVLARAVVGEELEWNEAIARAQELGITNETDVTKLYRPVTKGELTVMMYRAKDIATEEEMVTEENIEDIISGLIGGEETTDMTEEEMTEETTMEEETMEETVEETVATDDLLTVELDPDTPDAQYVPGNATHVKVMKVAFTAGSNDVTLNTAVIWLEGLINRTDVDKVYFVDENDVVVSNDKSFNTDYEATVKFNNVVIPANTTKSFYIAVDFDTTGTKTATFILKSVDATSPVEGTPLYSNPVTTVDYSMDTVEVDNRSSWTKEVYVGDTNQELFRFALDEKGQDDKDSVVKSIRFKASGDQIEGRVDNIKVIVDGQDVTKNVVIDGRYATVTINDYVLTDGSTKVFYVYGDIVGGEDGDQFQLGIKEKKDVVVLQADTNAALAVTGDVAELSLNTAYGKLIQIKEGDMLITKSSDSPTSSYIPNDEKNVTVLVANFNVTNDIDVEDIVLQNVYSDTGTIDEIKLFVDDRLVDSVVFTDDDAGTVTTNVTFNFDDTFTAGTHTIVVKVDTSKDAANGNQIKNILIDKNSFINAEYSDTKNNAQNDIKGSATSATFTIKEPALDTVARTDGYAPTGEKVVKGVSEFKILKFTVQANNVRDLTINGFDVDLLTGDKDGLSTIRVVVDGEVKDTEDLSDGSATFNGLDVVVPKGQTKDIELLLDITTAYNTTTYPKLQIRANNFDVIDSNGNTVDTAGKLVDSATFDVIDAGSVNIVLDSNSPTISVHAANPATEVEVARYKFKALDDDLEIQELTLVNWSWTAVTTDADSVISTVYIYDTNGEKLGEATLTEGKVYFPLSTPIVLPRNEEKVLVIKVKPNYINSESQTNKYVAFKLTGDYNGYLTKIISKSNGVEVTVPTVDAADKQYFRKTIITVSADNINGSLVNGTNVLYTFTLTPDTAGSAKVKALRFNIDVSDVDTATALTLNNFELYINGGLIDNGTKVTWDATTLTAWTHTLTATFTGTYINGYEFGSPITIELKANVSNSEDNDSVTTKIDERSTDMGVFAYSGYAGDFSIIWSDKAADVVDLNTVDWFTEANIPGVPASTQTLTK